MALIGKSPSTIPVVSREKAAAAARPAPRRPRATLNLAGFLTIIVVLILVLLFLITPLKNYYQGRAEIARLTESIAAKQAEQQFLQDEIARYSDEEFLRQEARRRLGVIEEGETAWRVLDPRMSAGPAVTTGYIPPGADREWYEVLWDAVSQPPAFPSAPTPEMP